MSKFTKLLALVLALMMVFAFTACQEPKDESSTPAESSTDDSSTTEPAYTPEGTLVIATATLGQKFSPFFYTTAYDGDLVNLTTGYLLASDREGAIVFNGIEGETRAYNGTDYTYKGLGNLEVVQNSDGTVDYKLTMRDDVVFSDGEKATIDDVIFGIYVLCDPTYDGSSTLYALPIKGMKEYRGGMDRRGVAIYNDKNEGYNGSSNYTEAQYNEFWDYYNNKAGADFAQEIVDYCMANYLTAVADKEGHTYAEAVLEVTPDEVKASEELQVKFGMFMWGFDEDWKEGATTADYWNAIVAAYPSADEAEEAESAGSTRLNLTIAALGEDYVTGVVTGKTADKIEGIERTGDYSLTIHTTEYDAVAQYEMGFIVAPLHYYGDKSAYDYSANKFGFTKGDLSGVRSKTTKPLGCGPFVFQSYENGVATLTANTSYYLGSPRIATVQFKEGIDSDYVPGVQAGTYDVASPSISDTTVTVIQKANPNNQLIGDVITTALVDYRGYGYIGINADLVNIDNTPDSAASKALRKGFMTLLAVYRDTVINSYYGERATVVQYPISNTSWAAPRPADEGYRTAYSVDADGKDIFTDSMNDEEKAAAALKAAVTFFKAAGFTYDEASGKFTGTPEYNIMIPGSGEGDHPAYNVAINASNALESIGIKLVVDDVSSSVWNKRLEGNTAQMWAAAWQASVDPDMTQVYHSDNAHGEGTNSNHYQVDDAELDKLIVAGRSSADNDFRKATYKSAFDIVLDWGVELPLYQRKDGTIFSTERVVIDTVPKDMTPYWGWAAEIETLQVKVAE